MYDVRLAPAQAGLQQTVLQLDLGRCAWEDKQLFVCFFPWERLKFVKHRYFGNSVVRRRFPSNMSCTIGMSPHNLHDVRHMLTVSLGVKPLVGGGCFVPLN